MHTFRFHVIKGYGTPLPLHENLTGCPSRTFIYPLSGSGVTDGDSVKLYNCSYKIYFFSFL